MKKSELVQMIREEVLAVVANLMEAAAAPPKSFSEFRKAFAMALEQAGAPDDLVDEALDEDYEGGPIFGAIYEAWTNIEAEMSGIRDPAERHDTWLDMVEFYVHDAVLDMADSYFNAMNYAPGHRPAKFDPKALATAVVSVMSGSKTTALIKKAPKTLTEVVNAVREAIRLKGTKVTCSPIPDAKTLKTKCSMMVPPEQCMKVSIYLDEVMIKLGFESSIEDPAAILADTSDEGLFADYTSPSIRGVLDADPVRGTIFLSLNTTR
jgi:hypothetical protein